MIHLAFRIWEQAQADDFLREPLYLVRRIGVGESDEDQQAFLNRSDDATFNRD
jgi:hypothetical protein